MNTFSMIAPTAAFVGQDGRISREWFIFLSSLFTQVGSGKVNYTLGDFQIEEEIDSNGLPDILPQVARNAQDSILLDIFPQLDAQSRAQPVSAITVGASPYVYTAAFDGAVIVSGGGLTNVEFTRDGTNFFTTGGFRGMFPLSRGDALRVTYINAPAMTFVPR